MLWFQNLGRKIGIDIGIVNMVVTGWEALTEYYNGSDMVIDCSNFYQH
jgi:tetrahydromethanopterin S-methyltransferase subunit G